MDMLGALALFARAAEAKSFSEAARHFRMTPSAVSRSVARLEQELDARLLIRSTHAVTLTEAGQVFLERATRILADFADAREAIDHERRGPRGTLRVDAPLGLGRLVLAPIIPEFLRRHRDLRVELSLRDAFVDPVVEGVDVLVRIGEPSEASLSIRKLGVGKMVIAGSPKYLKQRGVPRSVEDLAQHECLPFLRAGRPRPWLIKRTDATIEFAPRGRFATDNAEVLRDAAVSGLGLVCLLDFMMSRELEAGTLRVVLEDETVEGRPLYAVQPLHRHPSAKVRAFIDYLVEVIGSAPSRHASAKRSSLDRRAERAARRSGAGTRGARRASAG
jgi:DNA-binding transcriptional LysR family regulator